MRVIDYFYEHGTKDYGDRIGIEWLDRQSHTTDQYLDKFFDRLSPISLEGNTAVLYVGGVSQHVAECRDSKVCDKSTVPIGKPGLVIKSLQGYMLHKYIGILNRSNKIVYANINGNTCASSLHSIYEAESLLTSGRVDNVIIIAEEKTTNDTVRIFDEHNIDLKVGEGFACMVLSNGFEGTLITDTKWEYNYDRNPFLVSKEGYSKVYTESNIVKGHMTGTTQNDSAECFIFGDKVFSYKPVIGHCQGASGLIEACMVLDDSSLHGRVLCVSSGLGGFYGSCLIHK